jgi:hypothetical protein
MTSYKLEDIRKMPLVQFLWFAKKLDSTGLLQPLIQSGKEHMNKQSDMSGTEQMNATENDIFAPMLYDIAKANRRREEILKQRERAEAYQNGR